MYRSISICALARANLFSLALRLYFSEWCYTYHWHRWLVHPFFGWRRWRLVRRRYFLGLGSSECRRIGIDRFLRGVLGSGGIASSWLWCSFNHEFNLLWGGSLNYFFYYMWWFNSDPSCFILSLSSNKSDSVNWPADLPLTLFYASIFIDHFDSKYYFKKNTINAQKILNLIASSTVILFMFLCWFIILFYV